jgi:hypothetical protein
MMPRRSSPSGRRAPAFEGRLDDRVLGVEAGEAQVGEGDAQAGDGDGADGHGDEGHRQVLHQAAVAAHVLLVDMAWITEPAPRNSSALKKAWVNRWNIAGLVGADAGGEEHVAELRAGRIGDHPLDVVLGQADRRGEQGGDRADDGDDVLGDGAYSNIGDSRQTM